MSPRQRRLSSKEIIKLLESHGYEHIATRGDHYKMRRKGQPVVILLGRDPLRIGTQKAILDAAGIAGEEIP